MQNTLPGAEQLQRVREEGEAHGMPFILWVCRKSP